MTIILTKANKSKLTFKQNCLTEDLVKCKDLLNHYPNLIRSRDAFYNLLFIINRNNIINSNELFLINHETKLLQGKSNPNTWDLIKTA